MSLFQLSKNFTKLLMFLFLVSVLSFHTLQVFILLFPPHCWPVGHSWRSWEFRRQVFWWYVSDVSVCVCVCVYWILLFKSIGNNLLLIWRIFLLSICFLWCILCVIRSLVSNNQQPPLNVCSVICPTLISLQMNGIFLMTQRQFRYWYMLKTS